MSRFLLICLGGAVGTGARYLVGLGAARALGAAFPFGTLLVNGLGCFAMAFVLEAAARGAVSDETLRLTLTTGLLGGLTTYSAFNAEAASLWQKQSPGAGLGYLAATVLGCAALGLLGAVTSRRVFG